MCCLVSTEVDRARIPVALEHDTPPTDRIEFQRAIVSVNREGRLTARTTGSQQSSRLLSFAGANTFIVIPPRNCLRRRKQVDAILDHRFVR